MLEWMETEGLMFTGSIVLVLHCAAYEACKGSFGHKTGENLDRSMYQLNAHEHLSFLI